MKFSCLIIVLLFAGTRMAAQAAYTLDGIPITEAQFARGTADFLNSYATKANSLALGSWEEIDQARLEMSEGRANREGAFASSLLFSVIPAEVRVSFPDGPVLFISAQALDRTTPFVPTPIINLLELTPEQIERWRASGIDLPDPADAEAVARYEAEMAKFRAAEFQAYQARVRPGRYLIYRNREGRYVMDWWYEDRVQAMLRETGITIPRPTPYYPKGPDGEYLPLTPQAIEALVRLDLTDTIPPELLAKMQTAGTLPANFTAKGPRGNSTTPGANPPATSTLAQIITSPWLGWTILAAAVVAAALYLRRHRAKRSGN